MSEEREWPPPEIELHDAGHGVFWSKYVDSEGNWIGVLKWHICQDSEDRLVPGSVFFDTAPTGLTQPEAARWHVVKEDPLTLSPSLICRTCGLHGYFTDGHWVPV